MQHFSDPYFWVCVRAALSNPCFVRQWTRLHNIELPTTAVEAAIDEVTGRNEWVVRTFLEDVKELIYDRHLEDSNG